MWIAAANFAGSLRHPGDLGSFTWPMSGILWVLDPLRWTHHVLTTWLILVTFWDSVNFHTLGSVDGRALLHQLGPVWNLVGLHAGVHFAAWNKTASVRSKSVLVGLLSLWAVYGAIACVAMFPPDALARCLFGTVLCMAALVGWLLGIRYQGGDGDGDGGDADGASP